MKKIIISTIISCVASIVNAGEVGSVVYGQTLDIHQETYKETNSLKNNESFMKERDLMFGMNMNLDYQITKKDKITIKGSFSIGSSDYIGSIKGGSYGSITNSAHSRFVREIGSEYSHLFSEINDVNIGIGVNYRQLIDRLDEVGTIGYARENEIWYANLSINKPFNIDEWTITPKVSFKTLLTGKQTSYVSPLLVHNQNNGYGYDLEIKFTKKFNGHEFTISPYYSYMLIEDSDKVNFSIGSIKYTSFEPKNTTSKVGLNLNYMF